MPKNRASFTKDTIANRDAIQRSCFPTFDILNESRYRFDIELKDEGVAFNADPSLETKYRCVVKRDGVYGKTQYRGPNETLYTLAVYPALQRDVPPPLGDWMMMMKRNTLRLTQGIPGNHRYRYHNLMGLVIRKEENYANK